MVIFLNIFFLIFGFLILIKSAEIMIVNAEKLARMYNVPAFIIGFTVVAFGTSAPELIIGIISGINKTNLITLGDVIGSCIANITLILGIAALISTLKIDRSVARKEIPLSLGAQILISIMLITGGILSRIESAVLLILFAMFLYYVFTRTKNTIYADEEDICKYECEMPKVDNLKQSKIKVYLILILSMVGLIIGGNLIVSSSSSIARSFGVSDLIIGLTIVALGTSLPELVSTIMATVRKQADIAIGNIIGSNIFNILFVLGVSAFISPIKTTSNITFDLLAMLFSTLIVLIFAIFRKKIPLFGGIILTLYYFTFIIFKVLTE